MRKKAKACLMHLTMNIFTKDLSIFDHLESAHV
jgi:hypothetical protein